VEAFASRLSSCYHDRVHLDHLLCEHHRCFRIVVGNPHCFVHDFGIAAAYLGNFVSGNHPGSGILRRSVGSFDHHSIHLGKMVADFSENMIAS